MAVIFYADVLLAAIALVWAASAAMQDWKTREVANWLSFSLIIIALGIRAIAAIIAWQPIYFLYGILMAAIFFVVANIFYYARIFAGGDAKLLVAIAAAFATTPVFSSKSAAFVLGSIRMPFMAVFLANMLFVGAFYGIIWSLVLAAAHFRAFMAEFKRLNKKNGLVKIVSLLIFFLIIFINFSVKGVALLPLAFLALVFPWLLIFVKAVENACMVKAVHAKGLTEGDWLFKPLYIRKKVIMPSWEGLTGKDIALIKKSRIRSVMIKQGIPFTPVFLIALILSFLTNLLVFLVDLFI